MKNEYKLSVTVVIAELEAYSKHTFYSIFIHTLIFTHTYLYIYTNIYIYKGQCSNVVVSLIQCPQTMLEGNLPLDSTIQT